MMRRIEIMNREKIDKLYENGMTFDHIAMMANKYANQNARNSLDGRDLEAYFRVSEQLNQKIIFPEEWVVQALLMFRS